jgi:hypothetical protein
MGRTMDDLALAVADTMRRQGLADAELRVSSDGLTHTGPPVGADGSLLDGVTGRISLCLDPDDAPVGSWELGETLSFDRIEAGLLPALRERGVVRHRLHPVYAQDISPPGQRYWRICLDEVPLEEMPALAHDAADRPGPDLTWSELQASDLWSWFNLSAGARSPAQPGLTRVGLLPGACREFVDLAVSLDADDTVQSASLALSRAWLDADGAALANGADLAKTLLAWLGTADPVLIDVSDDLFALSVRAAGAIVRGPFSPPTVEASLQAVLDIFFHAAPERGTVRGRRLLRVGNLRHPDGPWFHLLWSS